jgi:hypothetical protein
MQKLAKVRYVTVIKRISMEGVRAGGVVIIPYVIISASNQPQGRMRGTPTYLQLDQCQDVKL